MDDLYSIAKVEKTSESDHIEGCTASVGTNPQSSWKERANL